MKKINAFARWFPVILLIGFLITSCSTTSYIDVKYKLPSQPARWDKKILIEVKDTRSDKTLFAGKAKEVFKDFTGIFSLTLDDGKKGKLLGTFDLVSLFKEAFTLRLEKGGVQVLEEQINDTPVLEIVLKEFIIEHSGRKWISDISYDAKLLKGGKVLAVQTRGGKSEQLHLFGRSSAEKVLGITFTDRINQLDLEELFALARLE